MRFGLLDMLVACWVTWWTWRGARRGLPTELPRTLGVFVFGVSGFGLLYWTNAALVQAGQLAGQTTSGISLLVLLVLAKLLVNRFRKRLRDWVEQHWGLARPWAGFVGGSRALMLSCILLAFLIEGPLHGLGRPLAKTSRLGQVLAWCLVPAERIRPAGG